MFHTRGRWCIFTLYHQSRYGCLFSGILLFMTFNDLGLIDPILHALQQEGYTTPTPIQQAAIPILLKGGDLIGCAQTGTGKTAAFAIPILQQLAHAQSKGNMSKDIKCLILTPTRELAIQIGAILSVVVYFRGRILELLRGKREGETEYGTDLIVRPVDGSPGTVVSRTFGREAPSSWVDWTIAA